MGAVTLSADAACVSSPVVSTRLVRRLLRLHRSRAPSSPAATSPGLSRSALDIEARRRRVPPTPPTALPLPFAIPAPRTVRFAGSPYGGTGWTAYCGALGSASSRGGTSGPVTSPRRRGDRCGRAHGSP